MSDSSQNQNQYQSHSSDSQSRYVRNKTFTDSEWLREQYVVAEKEVSEIASEADVAPSTIRDYLDNFDMRTQSPRGDCDPDKPYQSREWLQNKYSEEELSTHEIADDAGVCNTTILRWLDQFQIPTRSVTGEMECCTEPYTQKSRLQELYIEQELSMSDVAEQLGVTPGTIERWLDKHNIDSRSLSEAHSEGRIGRLQEKGWLESQYIEQGLSGTQIADKLDLSNTAVYEWLNRHDIPTREDVIAQDHASDDT